MKTAHQILIDLHIGQATTNALAERIKQPVKVLHAFCQDLELEELIERNPIKDELFAWRLTHLGRKAVQELQTKSA